SVAGPSRPGAGAGTGRAWRRPRGRVPRRRSRRVVPGVAHPGPPGSRGDIGAGPPVPEGGSDGRREIRRVPVPAGPIAGGRPDPGRPVRRRGRRVTSRITRTVGAIFPLLPGERR